MYNQGRPGGSWPPQEDPNRPRVHGGWPPDERYRSRDDQEIAQHHGPSSTTSEGLYHSLPPQQAHAQHPPQHPPQHPSQHPPQHPPQHPQQHPQHPVDQYPIAHSMPQMQFHQPQAPRQRTAIACRYCRRRKIRCSGFDSNSEGRCTNCIRFNQECVFTPVSSQTQAFVPAHARFPQLKHNYVEPRGPNRTHYPQLYGPHGQPLPYNMMPAHSQSDYLQQPGYPPPPSPSSAGPSYARSYEEGGYDPARSRDEQYPPPSLPPLGPQAAYPIQRKDGDYNPHAWRPPQANPPSSPPATLPPPRQFSPTRGSSSNGYPPPASLPPPSAHGLPPPGDAERHPFPGPLSQHPLSPGLPAPRRSSDPRDKDARDQRQTSENPNFPYGASPSSSSIPPVQSPQRSSSAGPPSLPHNPMGLAGPFDPPPGSSRSAADHKMLSSLTWKP